MSPKWLVGLRLDVSARTPGAPGQVPFAARQVRIESSLRGGCAIDGIINLNKPPGITSAKALYRVRAIVGQRKSGHAGTLDPSATGVLLICLGRGTKLVEQIMDQPKIYRATARLDVTSDSYDADAELRHVPIHRQPSKNDVAGALSTFEGEILQVPPAVSAVKVGGVPAYKRARRGETLTLRPRPARVYWVRLSKYVWPEVEFEMCCGRGTYVRAIVRDLGEKLDTGGCLTRLERTRIGPFTLDDAWSIESLEAATAHNYVIPMPEAARMLETVDVPISQLPDCA